MDELRWTLLGLGVAFIGGLAWWEMRKPRHSGSSAERDYPHAGDAEPEPLHTTSRRLEPRFDDSPEHTLPPDDDLPPLRAQETGANPPVLMMDARRDSPATLDIAIAADVAVDSPRFESAPAEPAEPDVVEVPPFDEPADGTAPSPDLAEGAAESPDPEWPPEAQRHIVSLRLVPRPPSRFSGRTLRQAFDACGLEYGAFDIYHLRDEEGRVFASAANLMRPGTFAPATMDGQHFHGVHLFCVLPGPLPAGRAVDELVALARDLAQRGGGIVLDDVGQPLDDARVATLRASAEWPARTE